MTLGQDRVASDAFRGAVAQMGERLVRNEEVRGSIPLSSTIVPFSLKIRKSCRVVMSRRGDASVTAGVLEPYGPL